MTTISFSVGLIIALGSALLLSTSGPSTATILPLSSTDTCEGCKAEPRVDDASSWAAGVKVLHQASGMTISGSLDGKSADCEPQELNPGPGWVCGPTDVCKWTATYTAISTASIGQFRDNFTGPCRWSHVADPFGAHRLAESLSWIASCDDAPKWETVTFYANATDCMSGTSVGEIRFEGTCTSCTGDPF